MSFHDTFDVFQRLLRPLKIRVMLMIKRCLIDSVDDSKGIQEMQAKILAGETDDEIERFQNYGFTAKPFSGSEAVIVFPSGNSEHGIIIVCDDRRYRLKGLANGEVALYDDQGQVVHLKRAGILLETTLKVDIKAPTINLGDSTLEKILKGETFQAFFNAHTHTGNLGVPTSPPLVASTVAQLSTVVKAK